MTRCDTMRYYELGINTNRRKMMLTTATGICCSYVLIRCWNSCHLLLVAFSPLFAVCCVLIRSIHWHLVPTMQKCNEQQQREDERKNGRGGEQERRKRRAIHDGMNQSIVHRKRRLTGFLANSGSILVSSRWKKKKYILAKRFQL